MAQKKKAQPEKARYRVTNWRDYNAALVSRGSVTLWLDETVIAEWHEVCGKGFVYSDAAIRCALNLRAVFGLAFRQTQGFLNSLGRSLDLAVRIPHYSTFSRRARELPIPAVPRLRPGERVHLAVDSTGLKVYGEGEWHVRTHGKSKRRTWRKLHLGVDTKTGEIVTQELTASACADGPELPGLLEKVEGPIKAVYGDKAYDSFDCHRAVLAQGADPVLLPKRGASIKPSPRVKDPPLTRGEIVRRMHEVGRKGWKIESGYHNRSLAETAMNRYKTVIGPHLRARRFENQKTEAAIGVSVLNRFTALGMPISVTV